jgi:hypothetical protein
MDIKTYNYLEKNIQGSQLGELQTFFFTRDLNHNGRDEIYFIEYIYESQFLSGYEFIDDEYLKIIDIDINGYYKKNFIDLDTGELNIVRGSGYKKMYQFIEPGIYRSWRSYYSFNNKLWKFEEIRTEEIKTPVSDFF